MANIPSEQSNGLEHPRALRTLVLLLTVGALAIFVPMWAPLVLAAWVAHIGRPLFGRWTFRLGRRKRAAATMVILLLLALVLPLTVVVVSLVSNAVDLLQRVQHSDGGSQALRAIVSPNGEGLELRTLLTTPSKIVALVREWGTRAWGAVDQIASLTGRTLIGAFVFLFGAYAMLTEGDAWLAWAKRHAPIRGEHFDRLVAAFHETGRGLFIGIGLTGLVQSAVATTAYVALGVPSALVLGLLTFFASLIPSIGTGLVWAPVAIGLALTGRTTAAIVMAAIGVGVISVIDNVVRPIFARYGKLDLPAFVVLVSMFGGLALLGAWGLVLGPLLVRLFAEAARIAREEHLTGA